ncbi:MAG: hypothetical protein Kow00114_06670 [Kiloniellaceae bacterium]
MTGSGLGATKDTFYGEEITPEFRAYLERQRAEKKLERSNAGKIVRRFANMVKALGFRRKSTWFAREADLFVQFIHIHKFTFGPCFRLHYGIRVLNDDRKSVALNGPDETLGLEYGTDDTSLGQCAAAMYSLVKEEAVPWFESQTTERLLKEHSCLYPHERDALRRALAGEVDAEAVQRSRELFGFG